MSSSLKNARTNISFLIFLSYQWYINGVFDRYDKIQNELQHLQPKNIAQATREME